MNERKRHWLCASCLYEWQTWESMGPQKAWCPSCGATRVQLRPERLEIEAMQEAIADLSVQIATVLRLVNVEVEGRAEYDRWRESLRIPKTQEEVDRALERIKISTTKDDR